MTNYSTIIAMAADGYAIEISAEETLDAIVALKREGEWIPKLADEEGKAPSGWSLQRLRQTAGFSSWRRFRSTSNRKP